MVEYQAFAISFAVVLILVGLPMLLFGILVYPSQPELGSTILASSILMLILGVIFIITILSQGK